MKKPESSNKTPVTVSELAEGNTLRRTFKKGHDFFFGDTKGMTHYKDPVSAFAARPKMWIVNLFLVVVFLLVLVLMNWNVNILSCFDRPIPWGSIGDHLSKFFQPNWDYFFGTSAYLAGFTGGVVYNCFLTFAITFIATTIAFFVGIPLGLLASHRLFGKWAYITEWILIIIRTFPELLLALILIQLSGMTTFTAIFALSLHSLGMIGKLYADQIDEADLDSIEALEGCGANKWQYIHLSVMPQVFPNFLSVGLYRLDINIRTGTMLGLILGQSAGIGFIFDNDYTAGNFSKMGTCTLGIVLLIVLVDLISSYIRKKLV